MPSFFGAGSVSMSEPDHTKRLDREQYRELAQAQPTRLMLDSELAGHATSGERSNYLAYEYKFLPLFQISPNYLT